MNQSHAISGYTKIAGFVANPAKHSLSPLMHNAAFELLDIDARYFAFELAPDGLARCIQSVRDFDMLGINLSMPFKSEVIQYMDEVSDTVKLIGAMNTVVNHNGYLIGHNTDGKGFMRSLADIEVEVVDQTFTMLGCGGAAIAIAAQAALDGVKRLYVINRPGKSYEAFAERAAIISNQTGCEIQMGLDSDSSFLATAIRASNLIINAGSIGMKPFDQVSPLADPSLLRPEMAVVDIIYNPFETVLMKQAQAVGCKTANGLGMLLYQGAYAFELWTGQEMPTEQIKPLVIAKEKEKMGVVR